MEKLLIPYPIKKNTPLISMQFCAIAVAILIHAAACSSADNNKITQAGKGKVEEGKVEITKNPALDCAIKELKNPNNFKKIKQIIGENEETIEGVKWTADKKQKLFKEIEGIDDKWKEATLLIWAASEGDLDTVKLLWHKGADLDKADGDGDTALMYAAYEGDLDIVKLLWQKGADLNKANNDGETALIDSASMGHLEVVKFLFDKVKDVNQADDDGETAFIQAASMGHLEVVKFLLNKKVKVDQKALKAVENALKSVKKGSGDEAKLNEIKKLINNKLGEK